VHPHVVETAGLRVRNGMTLDLLVPWEQIADARYRMRSLEGMQTFQVEGEDGDRALSIGVGSQTTVDLLLREPVVLPVRQAGGVPVSSLRVYADDARGLVARLRSGPELPRPADDGEKAR
jgi:hypothetical protein